MTNSYSESLNSRLRQQGMNCKATLVHDLKCLLDVEMELKASYSVPERSLTQAQLCHDMFEKECLDHISNQVLLKVLKLAEEASNTCNLKNGELHNDTMIWEVHETQNFTSAGKKK